MQYTRAEVRAEMPLAAWTTFRKSFDWNKQLTVANSEFGRMSLDPCPKMTAVRGMNDLAHRVCTAG